MLAYRICGMVACGYAMTWYSKEKPTPFDTLPLSGLFFLNGDWLAHKLKIDWTHGEKCPLLVFPSGLGCEIWESNDPENPTVHLFGEYDVPLHETCEAAYTRAVHLAEDVGYLVSKVGETQIEVWGHDRGEHFRLTYDDLTRTLVNIEPLRERREARPPQPLLDEATREKLPPLRSQEALVFEAIVHVKFFTPDSHWTWYATEASYFLKSGGTASLQDLSPDDPDIEEVIFFGLVDGDELEYGSFSLSELQSLRGGLGLPVERDRHFAPTTLQTLHDKHERERRGE